MNIYEKLNNARYEFLQSGIKKSGKNIKQAYMYFQLADIIPTAEEIFKKYKLLKVDNIIDNIFISKVINCEQPEETIEFNVPFAVADPIISGRTGGEVTNVVQRIGSSITYIRRYSWQLVMDIVEADLIDGDGTDDRPVGNFRTDTAVAVVPETKVEPKAVEEKKQALVEVLASADEPANEFQIKALKNLLKEVSANVPGGSALAKQILTDTNKLTNVSKNSAELIINQLNEKLHQKTDVISIDDNDLPF